MFTIVHLHLLLNHLPIIITGLGLVLVAVAAWRRDDYLARIALVFFVGGALSALPTYLTGEGAEHAVVNLPDVSKDLIEQHQDIALIAALVVGVLGVLAAWALWRYRRPAIVPSMIVRTLLAGGVVGASLMAYTGLLGGQIRHSEVRPGFVPPAGAVISSPGQDRGDSVVPR
jgi:uncharacterized membrane protein